MSAFDSGAFSSSFDVGIQVIVGQPLYGSGGGNLASGPLGLKVKIDSKIPMKGGVEGHSTLEYRIKSKGQALIDESVMVKGTIEIKKRIKATATFNSTNAIKTKGNVKRKHRLRL